jgi:hypothetical protein
MNREQYLIRHRENQRAYEQRHRAKINRRRREQYARTRAKRMERSA